MVVCLDTMRQKWTNKTK